MTSPTNTSFTEYNKIKKANSAVFEFQRKRSSNNLSDSGYFKEYEQLMNEPDQLLATYSLESRSNSLFLSSYFSVERHPKNYTHIDSSALKNPYFLSFILTNKNNPDLILFFSSDLLDEFYEQVIWKDFNTSDTPVLKYCVNEHYLKNLKLTDEAIRASLISVIYKNQDNLNYLPEKYLKDDLFFADIIYSKYHSKEKTLDFQLNNLNFPSNIFEFRNAKWWDARPHLVQICLNKIDKSDNPKFKNIKSNPYYQFLALDKFPKSFRKKEDITEETIVRILAAQHYYDHYISKNISPNNVFNAEKYNSEDIIVKFKEDLNYIAFSSEDTLQQKYFINWKNYRSSDSITEKEFIKPSAKFCEILQHIMSIITEEQYKKMPIFKHTSLGNPLLTLNIADNKPQDFMLSDSLISLHQCILMRGNENLYFDTISSLFRNNLKFINENLNFNIDRKRINFYDINECKNLIYPLLEEHFLKFMTSNINNENALNKTKKAFKF